MAQSITQVVTANDLFLGDVIYFTDQDTWTRELKNALVLDTPERAEDVLAKAELQQNKIVGAYLATVAVDAAGVPQPTHFREEFRTKGPSNYFHGKQAE